MNAEPNMKPHTPTAGFQATTAGKKPCEPMRAALRIGILEPCAAVQQYGVRGLTPQFGVCNALPHQTHRAANDVKCGSYG